MQDIINILKNYWPEILAILMFISSFILQFFRPKSLNAMGAYLSQWCMEGIEIAENSDVKGGEKLAIAVQYVLKRLVRNFPKVNAESYRDQIIKIIEAFLTLPQKKDI